ncbi:MAG: TolC family protein [candidate division WOR-3 bacterium]|uniref:TolC family protein n=2 Tax=candidate division WOR-3 bacterium TaxID=2052148 RepID=A0A7C1NCU8_UNCW3|nr:TolC family protein [candidate division WOR-3 bacterium]
MSRLNLKYLLLLIPLICLPVQAGDTLVLDPDRAVELALRNNLQLRQTQEKMLEAAAGKAVAFGSFLPQISASGSYTRLGTLNEFQLVSPVYRRLPLRVYDPTGQLIGFTDSIPLPVGADTVSIPLGSQNNYLFRASVQQTLFTWGKLVNAYRIAGLTLEIQKAAYEQAKQQLKVQTLEAFYQALLAQKSVELLRESRSQLERHVAQVERFYDEGLASRLDLMRARVGLTNLANQVSQAENGAGLAIMALRNLLGIDPQTPLRLEAELTAESLPVDIGTAVDSALWYRPELVQLRQALRIADLGVRIARTANLPTLFAAANYDYKRPVGFNDQWGKDWNATVGVSLPLFTGLANYHKLKQAQSRYRQAVLSVGMVEQAIRLEVEAAGKNLAQEWRNIRYQQENVNLAEEAFRLAEQRYENGLLSNLEYLDIQLQLTQSRLGELSALANYQIARARFLRATGKF